MPRTEIPDVTAGLGTSTGGGEFSLDFTVIEAAYPLAKLSCDTSDGCGQTCSTSACNSQANNPS
jgi:FxLD family lantipeptide